MDEEDLWKMADLEPRYAIAAALLRLAQEIAHLRRDGVGMMNDLCIRLDESGQTLADSIGNIGDTDD